MEIRIKRDREEVSIKLSGVIDEDNELAARAHGIDGQRVRIDLGEVQRINSCGVRDWVNWVHAIEREAAEIIFIECSPAIVAQINLVHNFIGAGSVESFFVPYYCSQCAEEKTVLCQAAELDVTALPPPQRCDGCDRFMDFDDMSDAYFAFMRSTPAVSLARKLPLPAPPPPPPIALMDTAIDTHVDDHIGDFDTFVARDLSHVTDFATRFQDSRTMHYLPWGLLALVVSALTFVLVAGT